MKPHSTFTKKKQLIITLALVGSGIATSFAASAKSLFVQVKQSALRAEPKFWAAGVANLPYGAELTPLGTGSDDKSWIKVKFGSSEGYVHSTAVTTRKVILTSSAGSQKVDSTTAVLAGKGFNRQVENSFASSKGISFASVDEVESQRIDGGELLTFLHDGKLNES